VLKAVTLWGFTKGYSVRTNNNSSQSPNQRTNTRRIRPSPPPARTLPIRSDDASWAPVAIAVTYRCEIGPGGQQTNCEDRWPRNSNNIRNWFWGPGIILLEWSQYYPPGSVICWKVKECHSDYTTNRTPTPSGGNSSLYSLFPGFQLPQL
jgi:hypothetical protein